MSSLPSYITSGASSRAHHAFLAKLHRAQDASSRTGFIAAAPRSSVPDIDGAHGPTEEEGASFALLENRIAEDEVVRCLQMLSQRGSSNKTIAETLIILLHTTFAGDGIPISLSGPSQTVPDRKGKRREEPHATRTDPKDRPSQGPDVALVAALQLATGSKALQEKRIGYLYLAERLPQNHGLGLMFINTIRKDLSSTQVPLMVLALHAIIKMPSPELAPAVVTILSSNQLLRHEDAMIRQKSIQALVSLHFPFSDGPGRIDSSSYTERPSSGFPLSMGKVARMLEKEQDPSVIRVLISLIRQMISHGAHTVGTPQERAYLVDLVISAAFDPDPSAHRSHTLIIEGVRCLEVLVDETAELCALVDGWMCEVLSAFGAWGTSARLQAIIYAMCLTLQSHSQLQHTQTAILRCFEGTLLAFEPRSGSTSKVSRSSSTTSRTASAPSAGMPDQIPPNTLIWAIKCLSTLPQTTWDGKLSEQVMATILAGLEHEDDAVRKAIIRLLMAISPDVIQQQFDTLISEIAATTDRRGFDAASAAGRNALRALEMLQAQATCLAKTDDPYVGAHESVVAGIAQGVLRLFDATRHAKGKEGGETQEQWEEGFSAVLAMYNSWIRSARLSFTKVLLERSVDYPINAETALLRAAIVCETAASLNGTRETAFEMLMCDIEAGELSISGRELSVVALAALLSVQDEVPHEVVDRLNAYDASQTRDTLIGERLQQVIDLCKAGRIAHLDEYITDHTLPLYYTALGLAYETYRVEQDQAKSHESGISALPPNVSGSRDLSASRLRYDAYAPPPVVKVKRKSKSARDTMLNDIQDGMQNMRVKEREDVEEAGEGTALLFDRGETADVEEHPSSLSASNGTIGSSRRVSDPFRI